MFLALFIATAILLIVVGAARIILGWILPSPLMTRIDNAVSAGLKFIMQLSVVIAAGFICYIGYLVWKG